MLTKMLRVTRTLVKGILKSMDDILNATVEMMSGNVLAKVVNFNDYLYYFGPFFHDQRRSDNVMALPKVIREIVYCIH